VEWREPLRPQFRVSALRTKRTTLAREQSVHDQEVTHGCLIDNKQIAVQRLILIARLLDAEITTYTIAVPTFRSTRRDPDDAPPDTNSTARSIGL
jgi:hypothetical protein